MKEHEHGGGGSEILTGSIWRKLIDLADAGTINRTVAKTVFEEIFANDVDPEQYVEEKGLKDGQ